ncbi:MAG: hypothetical protein ACLPZM_09685 [Thermoplasmata archaeon]
MKRTRNGVGIWVAVAIVVLFLVPSGPFQNAGATPPRTMKGPPQTGGPLTVSEGLTVNTTPSATLSPLFWGETISGRARQLSDEADLLNSTSARTLVFPGGNSGDDYDPLTNLVYSPVYSTTSQPTAPPTNESEFISWCRLVNCTAMIQLPGEINNASIAQQIVRNTVQNLSFQPAYWIIGNEPALWKRWDVPWKSWSSTHQRLVTPLAFAQMVANYSIAIRSVDPEARIVGLAGQDAINLDDWVSQTVWTAGPLINAISYHSYSVIRVGPTSIQAFYDDLQSNRSVTYHVEQARSAIANATALANYTAVCPKVTNGPTCSPINLFITEIGSGLTRQWSGPFSRGFPGGVSLASQTIQAMNLNVTNLDDFALQLGTGNSWITLNGTSRPDYYVYTDILARLGNEVYPANFTNWLNGTLRAVATVAPNDDSRADLLLANTNVTTNATLTPSLPGIPNGTPVELRMWSGNLVLNATSAPRNASNEWVYPVTKTPVTQFFPAGVPSGWELPPETVALFEAYPNGGAPIQFTERGSTPNQWWFVTVDGHEYASNTSNLTVFVQPGVHSITGPPLSVNTFLIRGSSSHYIERIAPFMVSSVQTALQQVNVTIDYVIQWRTVLNATVGGTLSPDQQWSNTSQPVVLTETPDPGSFFNRWNGWGPGSVTNSINPTITIDPTYHMGETAVFALGYSVVFAETGLPPTLRWSAKVTGLHGATTSVNSTGTAARFLEANGKWGFNITAPPGYLAHPYAGAVLVNGSSTVVAVTFTPIATPPPEYSVTFMEAGLPVGTSWTVTARDVNESSSSSSILFSAPNGTFGYSVQNIPEYRAPQANGSLTVSGQPTIVTIAFQNFTPTPPTYPVVWREEGLPVGTLWSIWVQPNGTHGLNVSSSGTNISYAEPNGTYGFRISVEADYRPQVEGVNITNTTNASVVVDGEPASISILFIETEIHVPTIYTVHWVETGLWNISRPANHTTPIWTVQLWGPAYNLTTIDSNGSTVFAPSGSRVGLPNGTYSYSTPDADGFLPQPAFGTFQVLGAPLTLTLRFTLPVPVYQVRFEESGLPAGMTWYVRLGDNQSAVLGTSSAYLSPSGTFTFNVSGPHGYFPVPSHGNVTVANSTVTLMVVFEPTQPPPPPSIWVVAPKVLAILGVMAVAGWGMFSLLGLVSRRRSGAKR